MASNARVISAADIATALGGPGIAGQSIGSNGTTPQWANTSIVSNAVPTAAANVTFTTPPVESFLMGVTLTESNGVEVVISIGTTTLGGQVLNAIDVPANSSVGASPVNMGTIIFQPNTTLYLTSPHWGGAHVDVKVWYAT